jgi:hypothetical protein
MGVRRSGASLVQVQVRDRYLLLMQDVFQMRQSGCNRSANIAFLDRNRRSNAVSVQCRMQIHAAQLIGVHGQVQFVGTC